MVMANQVELVKERQSSRVSKMACYDTTIVKWSLTKSSDCTTGSFAICKQRQFHRYT